MLLLVGKVKNPAVKCMQVKQTLENLSKCFAACVFKLKSWEVLGTFFCKETKI